jgi:hypothetical protein
VAAVNQRGAWLWGTFLSPPLTAQGVKAWEGQAYADFYTRRHAAYGLLVGRVFLGVVVSWPPRGELPNGLTGGVPRPDHPLA